MGELRLAPVGAQADLNVSAYQVWYCGPERVAAEFYSLGTLWLVRFAGVADFVVSAAADVVTCYPCVDSDAWRGIYEQQVEPLLLSLRGEQVFHGGAVEIGNMAIAFLGPSGRGKSTLTAAFARRDRAFLSDDCLHLDLSGRFVRVQPHATHVRLWEDSAEALGDGQAVYVPGSSKPRLSASDALPHCDRVLPLTRAYLLGDGDVEASAIEALSPSQQLIGWTANAFVLDIKNPEVLKRNLAAAARLVREVPMRRLDYPRRYDALDSVVAAVLADVAD